jgi:5-methylcytosine-specific restriction enzyme B
LQPPDPGTRGGGRLDVFYPSGEAKLAFWRDPDTNSNNVFFKGPFKDWFKSRLYPGAKLILKVRESAVEGIDALDISLPAVKTETTPLHNCCMVAVRPDWTDGHGILGYFNPLTNRYVPSQVLRFLLDANREFQGAAVDHRAPYPYFLILDEMNLAHVEQYFSDFLSCMESAEEIQLHEDQATEEGANEDDLAIPRRISIPPNVFFTGTVNVDETTYMFSPKVLDRAFTIELKDVDLRNFGIFNNTKEEGLFIQKLLPVASVQLPSLKDWNAVANVLGGEVREKLVALNDVLARFGLHFGYRVASEIACFVRLANDQTDGSSQSIWAALDVAILEKILPKFHGTQEELDEPLRSVFAFAEKGQATEEPPLWDSIRGTWERGPARLICTNQGAPSLFFPRTARKVYDMLVRVHQQGFATYIV